MTESVQDHDGCVPKYVVETEDISDSEMGSAMEDYK